MTIKDIQKPLKTNEWNDSIRLKWNTGIDCELNEEKKTTKNYRHSRETKQKKKKEKKMSHMKLLHKRNDKICVCVCEKTEHRDLTIGQLESEKNHETVNTQIAIV